VSKATLDGHAIMGTPEHGVGLDIAQVVQRAADGDLWAWERLIDQYGRLVWATHDFKLADSDASDVVQATWLRLLENIDHLEYPERVGSWLAATARHECLRSLTVRKKIVLALDNIRLDGVALHEPEIDERLAALGGQRRRMVPHPVERGPLSRPPPAGGRGQRRTSLHPASVGIAESCPSWPLTMSALRYIR
jgi:hypothetical protein